MSRRVHKKYIEPLVQAKLNGVIVAITKPIFDFNTFTDLSHTLRFDYLDVNTNTPGQLYTDNSESIQIGDTIRKSAGANYFSLTRKGKGKFYFSFPIDSKRQ